MTQLSKYFSEAEFIRSETAEKHNINNNFEIEEHRKNAIELCKRLDALRELFGALRVTSGYRSKRLNSHPKVRGDKASKHLTGQAADISPLYADIAEVWEYVKKNWNGGHAVDWKRNFIHLDTGIKRTWNY